jgi:hypothetical protein
VIGIDADMREFGEEGIKRGERELQAANADEIETLLTMLKLRDDWPGREMAWWLQWIFLKAATVLNYLVKNARISQFLDATGDYLGKVGVKVL